MKIIFLSILSGSTPNESHILWYNGHYLQDKVLVVFIMDSGFKMAVVHVAMFVAAEETMLFFNIESLESFDFK